MVQNGSGVEAEEIKVEVAGYFIIFLVDIEIIREESQTQMLESMQTMVAKHKTSN
jgi:hypothetical protein